MSSKYLDCTLSEPLHSLSNESSSHPSVFDVSLRVTISGLGRHICSGIRLVIEDKRILLSVQANIPMMHSSDGSALSAKILKDSGNILEVASALNSTTSMLISNAMSNSDVSNVKQATPNQLISDLIAQVQEFNQNIMAMNQTVMTLGDQMRSLEHIMTHVTTSFQSSIYQQWQHAEHADPLGDTDHKSITTNQPNVFRTPI